MSDVFYNLEVIIIIFVAGMQIFLSSRLYIQIRNLKNVFDNHLTVAFGYVDKSKIGVDGFKLSDMLYDKGELSEIQLVESGHAKYAFIQSSGSNEIISRIKAALNNYLFHNHGAVVNFSIIKDIVDREVDVKDEEISQSIPTPLYLGLAATMIGIIFGLLAMPKLNQQGFIEGINALIDGVKLAMTASLAGLLFTTILSSFFYKRAKRIVLKAKNDQLSYLQAKLLPELIRAEDSGVSGLKASLDNFSRETVKIVDQVRSIVNQTSMNIRAQLDVINKVENLNMTRISKTNLDLFDRLDKNMSAFQQFSVYLTLMQKISENLYHFSTRTENIETISNEIKATLNKSNELFNFLSAHINEIRDSGHAALKAVDYSDSYFKEAIEKLKEEINSRIASINSLADSSDRTLKNHFDKIVESINQSTQNNVVKINDAYNKAVPNFQHLDNLRILPEFKENSSNHSKELFDSINQLNRMVTTINNKMDNNVQLLHKLDMIEKGIIRNKSTDTTRNDPTTLKPIKPGFFKRLRNKLIGKKSKP